MSSVEIVGYDVPLWNIFVLFLIIASNYIGELFPCRIQDYLSNNVYLKHFISFLTLLFFVVLTDTSLVKKKFMEIFISSLKLYFLFLLLINSTKKFFIFALFILAIIYIIQLIKKDYINDENVAEETENYKNIILVEKALFVLFYIVLVLGFIIYLGEKKIEYKNKFKYMTFIFGKPSCKGKSPDTKLIESFLAAFK